MSLNMIFLHGLESSSQTYKAGVIRNFFPDLIVPDFTGSLEDRMGALYPIMGDKKDWALIGSSFGGLMAAIYTCERPDQVRKLVLLAPALVLSGFAPYLERGTVSVPTTVIHGTQDTVIPLEGVREIARKVFSKLTYEIVDDDHRLHKTTDRLDWKAILS